MAHLLINSELPPFTFQMVREAMSTAHVSYDRLFDSPPGAETPAGTVPLSRFEVGEASYAFREVLRARCYMSPVGGFEYEVDGFGRRFVGTGSTPRQAETDWKEKVHSSFQRLIRMRPFELTNEDRIAWELLEARIDVSSYRRMTPIRMRQIGRVSYAHTTLPRRVLWANGSKDTVSLRKMPAVFASLAPNQWFEAIVLRDPITGRLWGVLDVKPIPSLRMMSLSQRREFVHSLSSVEAPEADEV